MTRTLRRLAARATWWMSSWPSWIRPETSVSSGKTARGRTSCSTGTVIRRRSSAWVHRWRCSPPRVAPSASAASPAASRSSTSPTAGRSTLPRSWRNGSPPAMPGRSALRNRCPPRWSPRRSRWRTPGTLVPVPPSAPVLTLAAIAGEYHHLSIVEHRVAEPNGPNSKSRRILVVEDEPSIAGFVGRGLHFEGYDVDVVPDGPGALLRLRDSPPDLLVLDVMVPGVDGFEIARRLRAAEAAERLPSIPILMLTARDAVADRVTGLRSGADDYLVKPFDFDELLARIEALL